MTLSERIAIVGGGIAGLGAAWSLAGRHEVTLFEARPRLGGHAHTWRVPEDGRTVPMDTGFLVFNRTTYPCLSRLFDRLGVETRASDMSFGVTCEPCGLEYGGRGLQGVLAQPSNAFRPSFLRMMTDIERFNRWGRRAVREGDLPTEELESFLDRAPFSREFARHYLVPLTAALWSASPGEARRYPMDVLLEFLHNHRLLRTSDRLSWETVAGGSARYVGALRRDAPGRFLTSTPVRAVERQADGVRVHGAGRSDSFDRAILATHADQALELLAEPTCRERAALGPWRYSENDVWLHRDRGLLPERGAARSSWNYRLADCAGSEPRVTVSYHLNRLQRLESPHEYVVTLNPWETPDEEDVVGRTRYRHPVFTREAVDAREGLADAGDGRIRFCGAYLGNGFHEDALVSGLEAAADLGGRWP